MSPSWRVVRLDLPGFGLTGPYPSGDYSPAATVDFLERFADAAGLKRFVIAGSSLGGQAAWRYALRRPDRISGRATAATADATDAKPPDRCKPQQATNTSLNFNIKIQNV